SMGLQAPSARVPARASAITTAAFRFLGLIFVRSVLRRQRSQGCPCGGFTHQGNGGDGCRFSLGRDGRGGPASHPPPASRTSNTKIFFRGSGNLPFSPGIDGLIGGPASLAGERDAGPRQHLFGGVSCTT